MVDLVLVNQCCLPGNNGLNSRSGPHGISTNVALLAGGYGYETMLLPRTSKQGKEKTLRIVGFGPSALGQHWKLLASAHHLIKPHCKLATLSPGQKPMLPSRRYFSMSPAGFGSPLDKASLWLSYHHRHHPHDQR